MKTFQLFLCILKREDFSFSWSVDFPIASHKAMWRKSIHLSPHCDFVSSWQIAMFHMWDSLCLVCYLISGQTSFPDAQSKGPLKLQGKQTVSVLSTSSCCQVCGDIRWRERSLLGLLVCLNSQHPHECHVVGQSLALCAWETQDTSQRESDWDFLS